MIAISCVLAVAPSSAQEPPPGLITKSYALDVKPGAFLTFESAYREHLRWHAKNEDGWAWNAWQVVNGAHLGRFLLLSHGHSWEDFDSDPDMRASEWADFLTHVAPHLENLSSTLQTFEPTLSNWPADAPQPRLVEITEFELSFDGFREFRSAIAKIHDAVVEKDPDRHYGWFSTLNGSSGLTMTLAVPHATWADLAPEEPPLWTLVAEVYGEAGANEIRTAIAATVNRQQSYIVRYREDLSYQPTP
jgi:hypothetical protein